MVGSWAAKDPAVGAPGLCGRPLPPSPQLLLLLPGRRVPTPGPALSGPGRWWPPTPPPPPPPPVTSLPPFPSGAAERRHGPSPAPPQLGAVLERVHHALRPMACGGGLSVALLAELQYQRARVEHRGQALGPGAEARGAQLRRRGPAVGAAPCRRLLRGQPLALLLRLGRSLESVLQRAAQCRRRRGHRSVWGVVACFAAAASTAASPSQAQPQLSTTDEAAPPAKGPPPGQPLLTNAARTAAPPAHPASRRSQPRCCCCCCC